MLTKILFGQFSQMTSIAIVSFLIYILGTFILSLFIFFRFDTLLYFHGFTFDSLLQDRQMEDLWFILEIKPMLLHELYSV